jgi:hypothetical protein
MMRRTMLVLTLVTASAGAQIPALAPGSRLKIEMVNAQKVEGTLMSQTPDSLVIAADGALITNVPSASIGRIKSTMGKSRGAGAKKGARIGAMIGGGAGVLFGLVMTDENPSGNDGAAVPLLYGIVGAAEGALYGVIIGAIAGSQNWKTVYERPYAVTLAPASGNVRLGFSVAF